MKALYESELSSANVACKRFNLARWDCIMKVLSKTDALEYLSKMVANYFSKEILKNHMELKYDCGIKNGETRDSHCCQASWGSFKWLHENSLMEGGAEN